MSRNALIWSKIRKLMLKYILPIFVLFLFSCSSPVVEKMTSPELTLEMEGPIYEGANTAIGVWKNPLEAWLKSKNIDKEKIKNIKIVSVKFQPNSPLSEKDLQEITLQLTAKSADMQKIAFLNPYPAKTGLVDLKVAEEQNHILELFLSPELTVVADVNINKDFEENLSSKIILEFEISYQP